MNKFKITFIDESSFEGNPFNSEWKKMDDKPISKLEYILGNNYISMEGYNQYNHTLECTGMGVKGISRILLMGRKEETTDIIIFDLKKNTLYKEEKEKYREYGNQILDGWMPGDLKNPRSYFKRIQNEV